MNGKIYVGAHVADTLEDGYLGSGKVFSRAVDKYGRHAFVREILFYCANEKEMLAKEREIVTPEFCARPDTYNITVGGWSWYHVNATGQNWTGRSLDGLAKGRSTQSAQRLDRISRYDEAPRRCKTCGGPLDYERRTNRYCSSSCSARSTNRARLTSDDRRARVARAIARLLSVEDEHIARLLWLRKGVACGQCGAPMKYENRKHRFCGYSCSSTWKNFRMWAKRKGSVV